MIELAVPRSSAAEPALAGSGGSDVLAQGSVLRW